MTETTSVDAVEAALVLLKVGIDDLLRAERTGQPAYTSDVEEEWRALIAAAEQRGREQAEARVAALEAAIDDQVGGHCPEPPRCRECRHLQAALGAVPSPEVSDA